MRRQLWIHLLALIASHGRDKNGAVAKNSDRPTSFMIQLSACAQSTSRIGFSRYPFTACRKRATSAPSEIRWSAESVIFIL